MRVAVITVIMCVGLSALTPLRASGQTASTATPTPSPTTTSTTQPVPDGADLIAQMQRTMAAKNSYHMVSDTKVTVPSELVFDEHVASDLSNKPIRAREVATVTGTETTDGATRNLKRKLTLLVVGKRVASRTGKGAWACQSLTALVGLAKSFSSASLHFENTVNLGAETYAAIPVWHVHVDIVADLSGSGLSVPLDSQTLTVPTDLYISQADQTLVHEMGTLDVNISGTKAHELFAGDFSRYGESVKVKLPSACAKKP